MINKLKKFILYKLRDDHKYLHRIINKASVRYIPADEIYFTGNHPQCEISISNELDYDKIVSDKSYYEEIIKPIIALAHNIDKQYIGRRFYYPINVKFLFDLESREDVNIANVNEDVGSLHQDKEKMIARFKEGDYDGCLTITKSLLESAFKIYLDKKNIEYKKNDKFPYLQKLVMESIKKNRPSHSQRVINGIKTICNGINESRNQDGDGHGSNPETRDNIDHDILKIIIETTISITHFIMKQL